GSQIDTVAGRSQDQKLGGQHQVEARPSEVLLEQRVVHALLVFVEAVLVALRFSPESRFDSREPLVVLGVRLGLVGALGLLELTLARDRIELLVVAKGAGTVLGGDERRIER